ncbi:MAG: hypothetical protein MJZ82_00920 [Paludibacteraceae bacterium]|nr:hypothetical protein [Paludibacteraceae bacterium]
MKKFMTLICAIAIAFSASAKAPVATKQIAAQKQSIVKLVQPQQTPVVAPRSQMKAAVPAQKMAMPANATMRRAQMDNINFVATEVQVEFYDEDNDVFIYLGADNGDNFRFDIVVPAGETDIVTGQTYTLTDMLADYSWGQMNGEYVNYTAATIVRSLDADGNFTYNATVTGDDGNDYTITYVKREAPATYDTVEVVIPATNVRMTDAIAAMGAVQFQGYNNDYLISFAYETAQITGTYTQCMEEYTGVFNADGTALISKVVEAHATVTAAGSDYTCDAYIYCYDGNCYHASMTFAAPQALNQVTINADNLVIDDSMFQLYLMFMGYGLFDVTASDANYSVALSIESMDAVDGTYSTGVSGTITALADNTQYQIYSVTTPIVVNTATRTVTGSVLCFGDTEFTFNFSYTIPEPTETATFTGVDGEFYDGGNVFQFMAYNADESQYCTLAFMAGLAAGNYTTADAYADYCYIVDIEDGEGVEEYDLIDVDVTVSVNADGTYNCNGTMLTQAYMDPSRIVLFTIVMNNIGEYEEPTELEYDAEDEDYSETFTLDMTEITDYVADYSVIEINADNDNMAHVALEFNTTEGLHDGQFDINESGAENTFTAAVGVQDGSVYPSFAGYTDEEGYITTPIWFMVGGSVTVKMNGDELQSLVVNAVNSYGRYIHVEINATGTALGETKAEVNAEKVIRNGQLVIRRNGQEFNAQGAAL